MPTRSLSADHEILDRGFRLAPEGAVAVTRSMSPCFEAIVEPQSPQQEPQTGRCGFADVERLPRRLVDQQHLTHARPAKRQAKCGACRAGAQDQDIEVTFGFASRHGAGHFASAGGRGSLRWTSTNCGAPDLPTSRTNPSWCQLRSISM